MLIHGCFLLCKSIFPVQRILFQLTQELYNYLSQKKTYAYDRKYRLFGNWQNKIIALSLFDDEVISCKRNDYEYKFSPRNKDKSNKTDLTLEHEIKMA